MGATGALARSELRRRWRATLTLTLLVGLSGAVVLTAAAGARRTGSAFDRLVASTLTADAQVQYSAGDGDVDEEVFAALRSHPDVEVAAALYITITFSEDSAYDIGIFSSSGPELFRDIDKPRLFEGRLPDATAPDEVLLNRFTQDQLDVELGDIVRLGTFSAEQFEAEEYEEPSGPTLDLRVVGIASLAYDIADEEFPFLLATPAFHERYGSEAGTYGPMVQLSTRTGADPREVVDDALAGVPMEEIQVSLIEETVADVEDETRAVAFALGLFAAAAGLAALVAAIQAMHRRMAEAGDDQFTLRAMGLSRGRRVAALCLGVAPAAVIAAVVATTVAIAGSAAMPVGSARVAEPDPGIDVDVVVLAIGFLAITACLLLAAGISAWRIDARSARAGAGLVSSARRRPGGLRLLRAWLGAPSHLGVSMALDPGAGRTAVPVRSAMIGSIVGIAGVAAVLTFGTSLDTLVNTPSRVGWNWTLAPDVQDEDLTALLSIRGVQDVGLVQHRQVIVNDDQLLAVAMQAEKGSPSLTVLHGRMPSTSDEIALGPKTADRWGVQVGSRVVAQEAGGGSRSMVVVGEVLFPTFDEFAFTEGVVVRPEMIDDLAQSDGFAQAIVQFAPGITTDEAAGRITASMPNAMSVYAYPSLPASVANLREVRFLPGALGLFLGTLALAAIGHAVTTTVRRRRRDLGVVRSLGFLGADVRRSIAAQSTTLIAFGLLLGGPLGVALGRVVWGVVADGLGVAAAPAVPAQSLLALTGGALIAGLLIAALPGRAAIRLRPVEALRAE